MIWKYFWWWINGINSSWYRKRYHRRPSLRPVYPGFGLPPAPAHVVVLHANVAWSYSSLAWSVHNELGGVRPNFWASAALEGCDTSVTVLEQSTRRHTKEALKSRHCASQIGAPPILMQHSARKQLITTTSRHLTNAQSHCTNGLWYGLFQFPTPPISTASTRKANSSSNAL